MNAHRPGTTGRADRPGRSGRAGSRSRVFETIYRSAPIARVDLAERTGLTSKTISTIVDELMAHGLVKELGYRPAARAGRRAIELVVDTTSRYTIGVDVAYSAVSAAIVDLAGNPHQRVAAPPIQRPWDLGQVIPTAARAVDQLLAEHPAVPRDRIVGIGIGAPGRFRHADGHHVGLSAPYDTEWYDLGAIEDVRSRFGYPVTIDNNANTSALGELWFGDTKDVSDFVLMNVSVGIGLGIVLGGDVYRGGNHLAGEYAGHVTVDVDGPPCECGGAGCLHQYVSTTSILRAVGNRVRAGEASSLRPDATIAEVAAALHAGDPLAESVFAEVARLLAAALCSIVNTHDPQMILLGRDLALAGEPFISRVRIELAGRLPPAIRDTFRVQFVDVADAPLVGAGALALGDFFAAPLDSPVPEARPSS